MFIVFYVLYWISLYGWKIKLNWIELEFAHNTFEQIPHKNQIFHVIIFVKKFALLFFSR